MAAETAAGGGCPGESCVSVFTQAADVSLPVRLVPYARVGAARTECCCEPSVTVCPLPGGWGGCEVVITQTVRIRIPVEYKTAVEAGAAVSCCRKPPCAPPCPGWK